MPPCPRPACSATRWRTSPSSSPLHRSRLRQSGTSCPGVQLLPPPPAGQCLFYSSPISPCLLPRPLSSYLLLSPHPLLFSFLLSSLPPIPPPKPGGKRRASGPETDDPGMEMFALREMVNAPLPPPEEGRAENLLFPFCHWPHGQWYPKPRQKSSFLYLWVPRGDGGL